MRKTLLLAVVSLSTTLMASARAEDGLFSPLRLGSTSSSTGRAASTDTAPRTLSNASAVQTLLLAAGYTARIDERETLRIDISRGEWTAPVLIQLADAGHQVRMAMRLSELEANTIIAPKTLRGMLQANRTNWGAFFAIAGQPQRIELVKTISNNGLDSELLRTELEKLAEMAEKTRDIWNAEGIRLRQSTGEDEAETAEPETNESSTPPASASETPQTPTTTTTQPEAKPAAPATLSLDGKWIATPTTNEAFALQIDTDSSFKLVHVKGTKSTKSKGTWTLAGTTLTLKGDDGTTIAGTVARKSDSFTLTMSGAGGKSVNLTFKSGT